jgi:spore coat polysaccharide biosynthesis protein SpsF
LRVFRGHSSDVLSRFVAIGRETRADWCLRVRADNPFLDAPALDALLEARDVSETAKRADAIRFHGGLLVETDPDCRASHRRGPQRTPRLPVGYGVELVRHEALELAHRTIAEDEPQHRIHVTSWLHAHARVHPIPTPSAWPDRPEWRWSIETYEDLAMARSAFRAFGAEAATIDYPLMVARLDTHPEITRMNQHIEQKHLEEG